MPKTIYQDYFKRSTQAVADFTGAMKESSTKGGTFDSAAADDFVTTAMSQGQQGTDLPAIPKTLEVVLDEAKPSERSMITGAILDGIANYEERHGTSAPADVLETALHRAYSLTDAARRQFQLDSATSQHHDQLSLQPNRAVVAIMAAITEAIPFAHYLPADIGSNEARLAIMTHVAGTDFGAYSQNEIMDGVGSGDSYISASRIHTSYPSDDTGVVTGKITKIQATDDTCSTTAGDLVLLRGRTLVYINGRPVAREIDSSGTGNSPVSGSITIGDTNYIIGGAVNTDTGEYTLTTTPAMPATVPVSVEGFIDYERDSELVPSINSNVNVFKLYATPWRVITRTSIDSRTQMANELGLDPFSEGVIAIQGQFANERHYNVLRKGSRLAQLNVETFDFDSILKQSQRPRWDIWQDFSYPLGVVSQRMAEKTMNHGVTHLYVGKRVSAQWRSLPSTLFEPSGISDRPGIYRLGRLFGLYDVYYTPKGLVETPTSAQVLAAGRATDVTRNPVVLGDAVAPTVIPLSTGQDLRQGSGFYARNFTEVNPHAPSSQGFALINIINMA